MGHWSESLVEELAQQIGGSPDRETLRQVLGRVGREVEVMSGRTFQPARRASSRFEPNGMPFVDVPDINVGSIGSEVPVWEIPDPANLQLATVLQVLTLDTPASRAAPKADALWIGGQLLAQVSQAGRLSKDYVLQWLASIDREPREQILRRVMDPAVRFTVPVYATQVEGWWFQVTRRLMWVTTENQDEGRLLELLFENDSSTDHPLPLVAVEPIMIMAPMTRQPADWAFAARIWTQGVQRPIDRPWRMLASAVHGSGMPTVTLDTNSTPYEIACQVLLKGYWHGYIGGDEPALVNAVALAYPRPVERIHHATRTPTITSAAATLLGQLIRPGFDPAQGSEATRRYVRRKASIVVMEHRKREMPDRYPWTRVGISERRYYKLLPLFARKVNGRYDVDHEDVIVRMKDYLDGVDHVRAVRTAALDVLRSHGFSQAAARKWLQRHEPEEAVGAYPRNRRG